MRSTLFAYLLVVCSLFAAFAPVVMAAPQDEEIPQVRITTDKDAYHIGDTVNATVHVTANGRAVDPDFPFLMAILINYTMGEQPKEFELLTVERVAKGEFKTSFMVEAKNLTIFDPVGDGLQFMGKAVVFIAFTNYNEVQSMAEGIAWVEEGPRMAVSVSDPSPSPGETVTVTVTTFNRTLVDAQDVTVGLVSYDGAATTDLGQLTVTRESLGTYKASYTVPVDLAVATDFRVKAAASFPDYNHSRYLHPLFEQAFSVRFFDVWGQNVTATPLATELALWIADLDGAPVASAQVEATFNITKPGLPVETISLVNVTSSIGRAGFSFHGVTDSAVDVTGTVRHGGFAQRIHAPAVLDSRPPFVEQPGDAGNFKMEAYSTNENVPIADRIHKEGSAFTQKFRAFNSSGPMGDKRVNWYLADRAGFLDLDYTVIESGYGVTDPKGDMTVTFHIQPKEVNAWLIFEANAWNSNDNVLERTEDIHPLMDAGVFSIEDALKVSVDRVTKADPIALRAHAVIGRNSIVGYNMGEADRADGMSRWGPFSLLGPESDDMHFSVMSKVAVDTYGVDLRLPAFVPEDQDYAFMVLSIDIDSFKIIMNYAVVGYNDSTNKGLDIQVSERPDFLLAGTTGEVVLTIDNTGQGTDTYTVSVSSSQANWVELPQGGTTVAPGGRGQFRFSVHVPADADEATYYFNVTVSSKDPSVNATVEVPLGIEYNAVAVEVKPTSETALRGDQVVVDFTVENLGQGADTFALELSGDAAGWATLERGTVDVDEGALAHVKATIVIGVGAMERDYALVLTAISHDGITTVNSTFTLAVLVDGVTVAPEGASSTEAFRGDPIQLKALVTNTGIGADVLTIINISDFDNTEDWKVTYPATVTLQEGRSAVIGVNLTVPTTAREGDYMLTFKAVSQNGRTNATTTFAIHIWVSGVDLAAKPASTTAHRGEQATFKLNITNTGQNRDVFALTQVAAPWASFVTFGSQSIAVEEGRSVEVDVTVGLLPTLNAGDYDLTVMATSEDGITSATATFVAHVVVKGVSAKVSSDTAKVQQGKRTEVTLTIENTGQGPDTYNILLMGAGVRYARAEPTVMTLAQGAKGTVKLIFEVPKNGTTGTSMLNISVLSSDTYFSGKAQVMLTVEKAKKAPGFEASAALLGTASVAVLLAAYRRRRIG